MDDLKKVRMFVLLEEGRQRVGLLPRFRDRLRGARTLSLLCEAVRDGR